MGKSTADTRKPYSGATRSLVIALDVGTTFSGVSYAILEPGEVPKIHGVTRFPGQEHVAGNSKIPSVMYYDKHGKMMAAGAEAESASVLSDAEDEGWTKAELFKLRMRPKTMKLKMNGMRLSPLPRRKTAVDVFGDFLAYLFHCTRNFIIDTHANGPALWHAVEHDMQFVLSHPNGWEGAQQTKMRRAAVYGGLIPDTDEGKSRIRFVTEGEASLHACVLNGLAADVLSNASKHGFLVADAGGGTLDISSYAIRGTLPLVIEEIAPPDCVFAGSVFVSHRARAFLEEKLKNSKYGTADSLDHITKRFDETTKRLFRDKKDLQFIPFGSPLDKDLTVGIRGGQLKLTGTEVAELFEPSIEAAVASIRSQIEASHGVVKSVWLVGGFAASPWLFSQLQERLVPLHVTVSRPDTQTSKAVADGAIGFYCDHHVSARMSRFMYGVEYLREFDQQDQEHVARKERLCELPSGPKLLPDAFDCILARSVRVKESTVFTRKYCTELTSLSMLSVFEVEIWCYRGGDIIPKWILRHAEDFSTLCVVRADLSPLSGSAQPKKGRNGKTYWTIVFSVEIHFGLTEFKARIKWVDNGNTKYGPASIVYNESGHRVDEDEPDSAPEDDGILMSSRSDQGRSEPASRARSRDSAAYSSRAPSAVDLARGEAPAFLEVPDPDALRAAEREREREHRKSRSHASPSQASSPVETDRERFDQESDRDRIKSRDKGKEKERSSRSSMRDPGSDVPSDATSGGSIAKLAETLTSVWGAMASPASPSTVTSPHVEPAKTAGSTSVKGKSPAKSPAPEKAPTPARSPAPEKAPTPAKTPVVEKALTPAKTPIAEKASTPAKSPVIDKLPTPAKSPVTEKLSTPAKSPAPANSPALVKSPAKTPARSPAKTPRESLKEIPAESSKTPTRATPELSNPDAEASPAPADTSPAETSLQAETTAETKKEEETKDGPAANDGKKEETVEATSSGDNPPASNDHTSPVVPESPPPSASPAKPSDSQDSTKAKGTVTSEQPEHQVSTSDSATAALEGPREVEKVTGETSKEGDTLPADTQLPSPSKPPDAVPDTPADTSKPSDDANAIGQMENSINASATPTVDFSWGALNTGAWASGDLLSAPSGAEGVSSGWGMLSAVLDSSLENPSTSPKPSSSPKPPPSPKPAAEETEAEMSAAKVEESLSVPETPIAEKSSDETGKEDSKAANKDGTKGATSGGTSGAGANTGKAGNSKGKKNKKKNKKKGAQNNDDNDDAALNEVGEEAGQAEEGAGEGGGSWGNTDGNADSGGWKLT